MRLPSGEVSFHFWIVAGVLGSWHLAYCSSSFSFTRLLPFILASCAHCRTGIAWAPKSTLALEPSLMTKQLMSHNRTQAMPR